MIETTGDDRCFPASLAAVATLHFDYRGGEGVDFEPYDAFESAEETTDWLRHWTGNHELDGDAYRAFGQDGTGGLAVIWRAHAGRPLAEQPVAFMGSEGETGLVAGSLSDFLWVLADGFGPREAALAEDFEARPDAALVELADRHATTPYRPARVITTEARADFPHFAEDLDALCR